MMILEAGAKMNTLINSENLHIQFEEENESINTTTFGDMFAISLVGFYTISALIISSWSAMILLSGNISNGGPIGTIFNMVQSSGII